MTVTPKGEKKPTVSPTENPTLAKMQDRERDILRSLPAYQEANHAAD
jgi:hypothetical protein